MRVRTCGWCPDGDYISVHVSVFGWVDYLEIRLLDVLVHRHNFPKRIPVGSGGIIKLHIKSMFNPEKK